MRKRTIIMMTIIMTTVLALPAHATECQTVTIEHTDGGPSITSRTGESPRVSIVGDFLNIGEWDGILQSVEVLPGTIGAIVCDDGSVHLQQAQPEAEQAPAPEVNASQDSPTPIYLVPRVQDVGPGDAV